MGPTIRPRCPTCGKAEVTQIGKLPDSNLFAGVFLDCELPGGWLYRCDGCYLRFRFPVSEFPAYAALYDNETTSTWETNTSRPDWNLILQYMSERTAGGRVLDFGCYTGGLLARIGPAYERYGVEINRSAAEVASKITGRRIFSSINEIPDDLQFDVIVACDVVEHVPDPAELIAGLGSLLGKTGVLILTTGDSENRLWSRFGANWWYCYYPEHISFISRTWLDRNADSFGLSLCHFDRFAYADLGPVVRPAHLIFTYLYGWLPGLYLALRRLADRGRGRPGTTSVTGVGVSEDHLLAVLTPIRG